MLPGSFPAPDLQRPSKASPQNLAKSHPNKTLILRFSVHNAKQSCSDTIYDRVASSGARLTTPPQTRTDPQGLQLSYICQVRLLGVVSPTSPTTCHHVCQRRRDRPTAAPNDLMSRHTRKRFAELGRNPTDATARLLGEVCINLERQDRPIPAPRGAETGPCRLPTTCSSPTM